MQMTTLSTQLSWWDLSEGRCVLEIEPPAAGHERALELEVLWGDGEEQPTLCTWRLSQNGEALWLIDGARC